MFEKFLGLSQLGVVCGSCWCGTYWEIDEAKAQGVARYEEIQLEYPWT